MIPFAGLLADEGIWAIIQYERGFAGELGPRRGMGHGRAGRAAENMPSGNCCAGEEKPR